MFKFKKRSARGIIPMQHYSEPVPSRDTPSAKMTITGEGSAQASDSVITDNVDAGAVQEPLVLDFATMHNGDYTKDQGALLTPPHSQKANRENQDHWLSDEERDTTPAPAPPDFTRRGIHIPSRTR
jgi:hypothetical protein